MKLKKLIQGLEGLSIKGSKNVEILGVCSDSRRVTPGDLFIARRGARFDGTQFIPQAISNGAKAVFTDCYDPFLEKTTQIVGSDSAQWEALLANRVYGYPSQKLYVCAVTGTKGKTTTTFLIKSLLDALDVSCGVMGTIDTIIGEKRSASNLTTHDVSSNHRTLCQMVEQGCQAVALEASSHGLVQGRLAQMELDIALFTNLMPDHLDYHGSMEHYLLSKKKLFEQLERGTKTKRCAIVNGDDPLSEALLKDCSVPMIRFGIQKTNDLFASNIVDSSEGSSFDLHFQGQVRRFSMSLIGQFNIYNVLGAICVGLHRGSTLEELVPIIKKVKGAPGRLERISNQKGIHLFVDYAHMGEALDSVLSTLRKSAHKRIITVFGAGGDRDPQRRIGMAKAAERWSDISIVTTDNPRSEDPQEIARQIVAAFSSPDSVFVEIDRRDAIKKALDIAEAGDIVLIAGKGHEQSQIFAHHSIPFDDREVTRELLADDAQL